jgi:hypothetical protein
MSAQLTHQGIQVRTNGPAAGRQGWFRAAWLRIRGSLRDMNYASRRVVEVQAPWSVDSQWHRR